MNAIAKLTDAFSETEIDDEIVVMKLADGDFFSITGSGCPIWKMIDGVRDRDALIAALQAEYDAEPGEIAADVDAFLDQLRDEGLLAPF